MREHLQTFVQKHDIPTENAQFYSHVLPSPQERTLSQRTVVGKNWALVGDAAAWVDPLTGEGLFYATLTGPGHIVLQTLPFSRLANRIAAAIPHGRDESKGLAGLGAGILGDIISGND